MHRRPTFHANLEHAFLINVQALIVQNPVTQSIHDGFQSKKHSLAVSGDLQQAYDRVWQKGLLMKMSDTGIHKGLSAIYIFKDRKASHKDHVSATFCS